jgi:hypothetical protein
VANESSTKMVLGFKRHDFELIMIASFVFAQQVFLDDSMVSTCNFALSYSSNRASDQNMQT